MYWNQMCAWISSSKHVIHTITLTFFLNFNLCSNYKRIYKPNQFLEHASY